MAPKASERKQRTDLDIDEGALIRDHDLLAVTEPRRRELVRSAAIELAEDRITVSGVASGWMSADLPAAG